MNKPTLAHLKRRFTVLDALQAPKLIFCQLTLNPGVSHNQSVGVVEESEFSDFTERPPSHCQN